jgi:hypothetical protein
MCTLSQLTQCSSSLSLVRDMQPHIAGKVRNIAEHCRHTQRRDPAEQQPKPLQLVRQKRL